MEAIATAGGLKAADGTITGHDAVTPCGRCRQVMLEAEQMAGRAISIYCASAEGEQVERHSLAELLPHAFGPASLGVGKPPYEIETKAKDA